MDLISPVTDGSPLVDNDNARYRCEENSDIY